MRTELSFEHDGKEVSLLVNDYHIATEMMKENTFYEHWLLDFIRTHFSSKGTFVDVGANTGNHTLFFSMFCKAKVIAVEPLPESYTLLVRNVMTNKRQNSVIAINVALSDSITTGKMLKPEDERSIGGAWLHEGKGDTKVTTLDDICKDETNVRVIKIDVEGNEIAVLRGGLQTIEQFRPELFIEIWNDVNMFEIDNMLSPLGYEMKDRYCHAPVYHFSADKRIPRTFKNPK